MNELPLHPAVVHVPLGVAMVVPLVAAGLAIAFFRGLLPRAAWSILVGLQLVVVGGGLVALRTGEAEEERVEEVVAHDPIEHHEEAGKRFVLGAGIALAAAIALLFVKPDRTRALAAAGFTALSLVVAYLGYYAGEEGGELVYEHGAAAAFAKPRGGTAPPAPPAHAD